MSENISIQEGGKSRNFTVNSLKINLQGSDAVSKWISEKEAQLDTININENGIYTPKGCGFSEAYVNVFQLVQGIENQKRKIYIRVPKTGDIADIETPDDFPDITDDTPWIVGFDPETDFPVIIVLDLDDGEIHEITIEDPELKPVIDEIIDKQLDNPFVYGLDPDTGDDKFIITDEDNYIVETDPIETEGINNINMDNGAISGIDGDGNEVGITIDDSGNIEVNGLPSRIEVTTMPRKTEYVRLEVLDLTGIVVTAYNEDGSVWGIVPLEEIEPDFRIVADPYIKELKTSNLMTVDAGAATRYYGQPFHNEWVFTRCGDRGEAIVSSGAMDLSAIKEPKFAYIEEDVYGILLLSIIPAIIPSSALIP